MNIRLIKKASPFFLLFICFHPFLFSNNPILTGVTTNSNISASELINEDFIGNNCYETANISYTGNPQAVGSFSGGSGSIGMENGVILSTGKIISAQGPNSSNGIGSSFSMISTDSDLQQLVGIGTVIRDLAVLEFDFVPTENTITFEYVFASEEYCEHIDLYNDAFGFFISGSGINGTFSNNSVNLATLPNGQAISVSNVNHTNNSSYYIGNIAATSSQLNDPECNGHPSPTGNSINEIEFDGYTVKMTATISVVPCETYHLKIAIADAEDGIYDSAVFLRANSFDAGGQATVEAINPATSTPEIQEGCESGYFLFTRLNEDTAQPLDLAYNILSNSTATAGIDYQNLSGTITIPAGQMSVQLPVDVFGDNILEGNETILLELLDACQCNPLPVQMTILDTPPLQVSLSDLSLCANENATLMPTVSGGMPPYSFFWNNSSINQNLSISPSQTTTYNVIITDNCGTVQSATAIASIHPESTATLSGNVSICNNPNASAILNINTTGIGPWEIDYDLNGNSQTPFTINSSIYDWTVSQNGTYELTSITDLGTGCMGTVSGTGTVQISNFDIDYSVENITCFGENNGEILVSTIGGTAPFNYNWNQNFTGDNPQNLAPGFYQVTVTDNNNCSAVENIQITQPNQISLTATVTQNTNCQNPNGGAIDLTISGGTGNFTFQWDNGAGNSQNPTDLAEGIYQVTATDLAGCTAIASAEIIGDFVTPIAQIIPAGNLDCFQNSLLLNGAGSSTGNNFSYLWTSQNGNIQNGGNTLFPTVTEAGIYELLVTNETNGCTAFATTFVQTPTPLFANISVTEMIDCNTPEITLNANNSSTGNNLIYNWITNNGNIVSGGNTLNPIVDKSGDYELVISNLQNGCTANSTIFVEENLVAPIINISNPTTLNCSQNSVEIEAQISNNIPQISIEWTSQNGQISMGQNTLSPTINQSGIYEIIATNLENGCTNSANIEVFENHEIPTFSATEIDTLTCLQNSIILNANTNLNANYEFELKDENENIFTNNNTDNWEIETAGNYDLTLTNLENGCSNDTSIFVAENIEVPSLQINQNENLNCQNPIIQLSIESDLVANFSTEWTLNNEIFASTENIEINNEGAYFAQITNLENGCSTNQSINILADFDQPDFSIETPEILTCNQNEVTLSANFSNQNFSTNWTNSIGNNLNENSDNEVITAATGWYFLEVSNPENGCSKLDSVEVLADASIPELQILVADTLTCNQPEITLSATLENADNFDIIWSTSNGNILSNATTLNPNINQSGDYILTVTNPLNNCQTSQTVSVFENTITPNFIIETPEKLTCNDLNINLLLNIENEENYSFEWQTSNGNITENENSITPTINQKGVYFVTVTNLETGCSANSEIEVFEDFSFPEISWQQTDSISCKKPETDLKVEPETGYNLQFIWTTFDGNIISPTDDFEISINAAGDYKCQIENLENGCFAFLEMTVFADFEIPEIIIETPENLTCLQSEITLNTESQTQNLTYNWSNTNGNIIQNSDSSNPTINAAGNYILAIENPKNGCTNSTEIEVFENLETPIIDAGETTELTCENAETILNGSIENTNYEIDYQWITTNGNILSNQNTLNPEINQAGIYTLIITNLDNGCAVKDSVSVSQNGAFPNVEVIPFDTINCYQNSAILNGENSETGDQFLYEWKNESGEIISIEMNTEVSEIGLYTFSISNIENGCTSIQEVQISEDKTLPSIEVIPFDTLNCNENSVILSGENSEVGNQFLYEWKNESGETISNEMTTETTEKGSYFFSILNTENGCTNSLQTIVFEDFISPEIIEIIADTLTCDLEEITIENTILGENLQFNWTTNNGNFVSENNLQFPIINAAGNYVLTVLNSENGCSTTSEIEIQKNVETPDFSINTPQVLTCLDTIIEIQSNLNSNLQNVNYQWITNNGSIVSNNETSIFIDEIGTYQLVLTNTENGCFTEAAATISENLISPQIELPSTETIDCAADFVTLNSIISGVNNYEIQWFQNEAILLNENEENLEVSEAGNFEILVTNIENGCFVSKEVIVEQLTEIEANFETIQPTCSQQFGSIIFEEQETEILLFSIDGGENFYTESSFENLNGGNYSIVVQNEMGCEFKTETTIQNFVEFDLNLENEFYIKTGESVDIQPIINFSETEIQEIKWTNSETLSCSNCLNPTANPTENTLYEIKIITIDNCEMLGQIFIRVDQRVEIFAPNIFSPNGDRENDFFYLQALENTVENIESLQIFDRWGSLIFSKNDILPNEESNGWDGTFKSQKMENGVFVWIAEVKFPNGQKRIVSGDVTLVR